MCDPLKFSLARYKNVTHRSYSHSTKIVEPGHVLYHDDDPADVAYLVREGVLVVSQISSSGREAITSIFFPGEICGGFATLTGLPHTGSARAPRKGQTLVEPIHRSELLDMVRHDTSLYTSLLTTQREKEKFKESMLLGMMTNSCEQRMASVLLWFEQKNFGNPDPRLHLTRQELADLIGTTMETVIRLMSRFRRDGLIEESDGTVQLNAPKLAHLAIAA